MHRIDVDLNYIRPFQFVFRKSLQFGQSILSWDWSCGNVGFVEEVFRPFQKMPGSLIAELVRVEEDMSLVHEEE